MRILVTNDDGIDAHGLKVLSDLARELSDDVWVIAPDVDNSGVSHSLTLKDPLRHVKIDEQVYSLKGTPTDCVIWGVKWLLGDKQPDLILSGVNDGQNIADDVTYSGTIAGAIEGCLLGIPSIALSLARGMKHVGSIEWDTPKSLGKRLIEDLLDNKWPSDVLMNVNFPDCVPDDIKGRLITTQGKRDQDLMTIAAREDPRGREYFWFDFERQRSKPAKGTDLWAIYNDYISITPLHLNLTHHKTCTELAAKLDED